MKVLVAVASRHGATREIADAIAATLRECGIAAVVADVEAILSLAGYDAIVLGSAVYLGRWLPSARDLVEAHKDTLRTRPVWLFSSGPLGETKPGGSPVRIDGIVEAIEPREHRLFDGRLDRSRLGLGEKVVVSAVKAPEGDFRDFGAIRQWALNIADSLGMPPLRRESLPIRADG